MRARQTVVSERAPTNRRLKGQVASESHLGQSETNVTTEPWSAVEWIADADLTRVRIPGEVARESGVISPAIPI